jgi:hypothetical protein
MYSYCSAACKDVIMVCEIVIMLRCVVNIKCPSVSVHAQIEVSAVA